MSERRCACRGVSGRARTVLLVVVAAAAAVGLAAFAWPDVWRDWLAGGQDKGAEERPPPRVELATAVTRNIAEQVPATGTLESPESITVTVEVNGRVVDLGFSEGQAVARGQMLVELDRASERARLAEARAQHTEAELALARQTTLAERELAADARVDSARAALATAAAAVEVAREALGERRVIAPFAGVAGARLVSRGAFVTPGQAITTLSITSPLDVAFDAPAATLPHIDDTVQVELASTAYPGERFEAELSFIAPALDRATRTLPLEATLDNRDGRLKPGMLMEVTLILGRRDALTVPEAALVTRGPAAYVYVVDEDLIGHRRSVTPGIRRDGWVEIVDGLGAGARVVEAGLQRLRDGQKVRPATAQRAPAPAGEGG
ncbi:MAG: efflux RND transporter periplasmic adaptor subunit [Gammaproteobacteria bacterium]